MALQLSKAARDKLLDSLATVGAATSESAQAMARSFERLAGGLEDQDSNQRFRLHSALFDSFTDWAAAEGLDVTGWTMAAGHLVNPLGDMCSYNDAAFALQRIAQMATVEPEAIVASFFPEENINKVPLHVVKEGKPTLVVWAAFDGQHYAGPEGIAHPERGSILVGLEGEGPPEAQWQAPGKLYRLLEFGYRVIAIDEAPVEDEDIPF